MTLWSNLFTSSLPTTWPVDSLKNRVCSRDLEWVGRKVTGDIWLSWSGQFALHFLRKNCQWKATMGRDVCLELWDRWVWVGDGRWWVMRGLASSNQISHDLENHSVESSDTQNHMAEIQNPKHQPTTGRIWVDTTVKENKFHWIHCMEGASLWDGSRASPFSLCEGFKWLSSLDLLQA